MKALTLTQPWASLIAFGAKRVETRGWTTAYRGPLAIHAAKGMPAAAVVLARQSPFREALGIADVRELPRGFVLATCTLREIYPTSKMAAGWRPDGFDDDLELAFGDFSWGRYAWILEDVVALAKPVPTGGAMGLWDWEPPLEVSYARAVTAASTLRP